jgi:hypothetical protein
MATGIVSIAAQKFGSHVVSLVLLALAIAAFVPWRRQRSEPGRTRARRLAARVRRN